MSYFLGINEYDTQKMNDKKSKTRKVQVDEEKKLKQQNHLEQIFFTIHLITIIMYLNSGLWFGAGWTDLTDVSAPTYLKL